MPQMNGLDFIQQSREKYSSINNSQLKIILISACVISKLTLKEKKIIITHLQHQYQLTER
jgi:two-component SAPR family response regulator